MTPARRFGLAHLATPFLAALPCVNTRMGDTSNAFSLYSIFGHAVASPAIRLIVPWVVFAFCTGFGASFVVRRTISSRARAAAIGATAAGFIFFLHQSLPMFAGQTQQTVPFLPPIIFRAGIGLWLILITQFAALRLAFKLPRESEFSDR